jgi:hypothetical protein
VSYCLAGLACVLAGEEDVMSAGWLWGAAEAIERRLGQTMLAKERQRYTALLRGLADDVLFRAAMRDGAAASTSDVVRRWAGRPG